MAKVNLSVLDRLKDKPNSLPHAGGDEDHPGLPSQPAFWPVDIDERGITKGLF